jgi:hypothetical protein
VAARSDLDVERVMHDWDSGRDKAGVIAESRR